MPKCKNCNAEIEFVYDSKNQKWVLVESYFIDTSERLSRRHRIPIPYDSTVHTKHVCNRSREENNYNGVYRG